MKPIRVLIVAAAILAVAGCATTDQVSRNNPMDATDLSQQPGPVARASVDLSEPVFQPVRVVDVRVDVPRDLEVSEANRYYPGGDIVWREDPIGDRYAQVESIVDAALKSGVQGLNGPRDVILNVRVTRFHALTEKARYTVGGVHAVQFVYTLHDPATGQPLTKTKLVKADFPALGGMAAIAAEQRGVTQKVRISQQLAKVIAEELGRPEGYAEMETGFMGAINQL